MNMARTRLVNLGIANPAAAKAGDVVRRLGALQAQDYGGTLWAIGLRMAVATEHAVEQAIVEGTIVRTWPLRGTLHMVAAQDVRWLLALLAPRAIAQAAGRYRQLELDEATFAVAKERLAAALQGGKQLTRAELQQQLEQAGIATTGQRGYHILVRSAQDGLICFGAPRGKQQTFVLLDEWVPRSSQPARDEALAELASRYVASHGPVTQQDLMRWAGLTAAEAKTALAAAGPELIRETVADRVYWLPSAQPEQSPGNGFAYLLPGFDEYMLGYGDRSAALDPLDAQRICPGGNGVFIPTIIIEGQVRGTWSRVLKKLTVLIVVAPFQPLTATERDAVTAAAARYGAFLGLSAVVTGI